MTSDMELPSDEELGALAMAADPDAALPNGCVPIDFYMNRDTSQLPEWYMPAAALRVTTRWRAAVLLALVVAFVAIEAVGLCGTYGPVIVH
jgi:hypothetical protein